MNQKKIISFCTPPFIFNSIALWLNSRPHISDTIIKQIHRQPVIAFLKNTGISDWDWKDQGPWNTEDLATYAAANTNTQVELMCLFLH